MSVLAKIGVSRLLPVSGLALTASEHRQAKLLLYRNAVNKTFIKEAKTVRDNANFVNKGGITDVPLLMLVSNGKEISKDWIAYQENFAQRNGARLERFDCGHYIHQHEPKRVARLCREFILTLE